MSLDRIDNDRGYEPGNVRWATKAEQQANRHGNRYFLYEGQRFTMTSLARMFGLTGPGLSARLKKGLPLHVALKAKKPTKP